MEKRNWLWKKKSSEKSPGETESSGSVSSNSEKFSDEQASPIEDSPSPEVNSKTSEKDENLDKRVKKLTEKLSAALVYVSAKDDLVKQHSKVAEEAIAGWEAAENEVSALKQQLEAAAQQNFTLENRVTHLDEALKECVRQLRQARDELEEKVQEAIEKKKLEWESVKSELENQITEVKAETKNSKSPRIDSDFYEKLEHLEKNNASIKLDLFFLAEELELRTIERDLSTQAAETASKQNLESIKKVAKLEAECRRLKALGYKVNDQKNSTASSICVDSFTESSQSESEERLSGTEPWASALIAELDWYKNRNRTVEIDLMDDFLEMERLLAMPEPEKNEALDSQISLRGELADLEEKLQKVTGEKAELEEKLEKILKEKTELETTLTISLEKNEELQIHLRETELKLEELHEELVMANESKEEIESQLVIMESEARTVISKANTFEKEAEKEKALSAELNAKCKALEQEIELKQSAISNTEPKIKQEDIDEAAVKLAECQKTIASLGKQLESLATLEDFLTDTVELPKNGSSETFSPNRESFCSRTASSLSSSSVLPNPVSYEKNRNGFAKFFSRSKNGNGVQLEI